MAYAHAPPARVCASSPCDRAPASACFAACASAACGGERAIMQSAAQAEAPSEARPSRTRMLRRCHAQPRPFSASRSSAATLTLASQLPPPQVEQLRQRLERSEAARNKLRQAASAGLAANAELQKELEARGKAMRALRCALTPSRRADASRRAHQPVCQARQGRGGARRRAEAARRRRGAGVRRRFSARGRGAWAPRLSSGRALR